VKMKVQSRIPYLKPEELDEKQREFYDFHIKAFQNIPYVWKLEDGELNGPSNALLHDYVIGQKLFEATRPIAGQTRLSKVIQEIAILVVVTSAKAAYGTYAHIKIAEAAGVSADKISTITAGQRPANLTEEEAAAYDFAYSLCQPGPVSDAVYSRTLKAFGKEGLAMLVWLIGMFKLTGTVLNAYNEPIPEHSL
jgi:4-carboxymuconolactone decarboxylase